MEHKSVGGIVYMMILIEKVLDWKDYLRGGERETPRTPQQITSNFEYYEYR